MIPVRRLFTICFLFLIPLVNAASMGIWPSELNVTVMPLETVYIPIHLFNPGINDVDAELYFICDNCYGEQPSLSINPSVITIPRNTSPMTGKEVGLIIRNPLIVKKSVSLNALGKEISLTSLIFDKKSFEGKIAVRSLNTETRLIITSKVGIEFIGINTVKFVCTVFSILLVILLLLYLKYRKIKGLKIEYHSSFLSCLER